MVKTMFKGSGWAVDNTAACLLFSSEAVVKQFLEGLATLEDQTPMQQVAEVCRFLSLGQKQPILK